MWQRGAIGTWGGVLIGLVMSEEIETEEEERVRSGESGTVRLRWSGVQYW